MATRRGAMGAMGATAALPFLPCPALAQTRTTLGALRFTSHAQLRRVRARYLEEVGLNVRFAFFQAAQPLAVVIRLGRRRLPCHRDRRRTDLARRQRRGQRVGAARSRSTPRRDRWP